jgi:hypothetical protein
MVRLVALFCAVGLSTEVGSLAAQDEVEDRITRGPYLQALVATSVEIVWQTRDPSVGAVRFSSEGGAERTVAESAENTTHRIQLTDLTPGVSYFYDVLANAEVLSKGEDFRFRTSPLPGEGVARFVALGDSGTGSEDQMAVARMLCELRPDVFLHTGDLIYTADIDTILFEPYRESLASSCFYPTRGNHDLSLPWNELFTLPGVDRKTPRTYYSFDWGSAHFAVLDSNAPFPASSEEQFDWLENDLAMARDRGQTWLILMLHKPPYTVGLHRLTVDTRAIRERIPPIADRFDIDLVLTGHDHNYQRTPPIRGEVVRDAWQGPNYVSPRGTIYIVTGGGGQLLYGQIFPVDLTYNDVFAFAFHLFELEIAPNRLAGRALATDGQIIDSFTIEKDRPRPVLEFLRGDTNYNGKLELADGVRGLQHLFAAEPLECPAVVTMEPGKTANITSPLFLLNFLFLGGPPPPPPHPICGPAPDDEDGFCSRSGCNT